MSYSPPLTSAFNDTKNRSSILSCSGMCSFCTEDCAGTCELGLAAVLGSQTVYPTNTGSNQVASEKNYPIDYSHFNINGRVFGAVGAPECSAEATVFHVKMETEIKAPAAGVIREINVTPSQVVAAGDTLVTIEEK